MKKILWLLLFFSTTIFAEQKTQPITVILDWYINPNHAPLIVAEQQGFFKEQGLEVKLITPSDPTDPPKWVAADKADVAMTYQPQFMQQVDHGLPLIAIGALIDKPLDCLVALKDSNIKSLTDLKGKRIGLGSEGSANLLLKLMLNKQHVHENEMELVDVHYNLMQALLSKKVDAVDGLTRNVEVPELELKGHQITVFFPEEYGVPNYNELIFVVNTLHKNDDRFPRFLAAIKKAVRYLDEHPKESWEQFAKQYPELNTPENQVSWFATMPYFAEDPASLDQEDWQHFSDFMHQHQLISMTQPISRYTANIKRIV